ncbi:hypothetical protein [Cyanophage S-TIM54]|nr:hypothetical protein [Cyanophage S-TIM54]
MKDNINYEAPEDWGVSSETEWVSHSELTDNGAPALEGQDVVGFIEFAQIKLAPGKPENAMAWRSEDGKPVALNPSTKRWQYVRTQTKPAQRPQQKTQAPIKEDKGDRPSPELEKAADKIIAELLSEDVKGQVKELEKRKQPKLSDKQEQKELNKREYLKTMVEALMADASAGKGAGKYNLSREDMEDYMSYLEGNKPTVPSYDISDEDIDQVLNQIKDTVGTGKPFQAFSNALKRKGVPPRNMQNAARARSVLKHYLSTGGVSTITGKRVPFSDAQLDHRISLANGGLDGPDNWEWVEARFNQYKLAFTDDKVREKLKKDLSASPLEGRRKKLQQEVQNLMRNSYRDYFKANGFESLSQEDITSAAGTSGEKFLKGVAEAAGVRLYKSNQAGGEARGRGQYVGNETAKKLLLQNLNPRAKAEIEKIDQGLLDIHDSVAKKQGEISDISSQIRKEKAEARKKAKANMTEMDYLELIKLSRNPEYADSMVYYKGKVLGRCPAGTTKMGKTCAPVQKDMAPTKYNKNVLGGLSKQQVARLAKAKTTEQIIEAHKEKEKEENND